jgi:hypothetical protein
MIRRILWLIFGIFMAGLEILKWILVVILALIFVFVILL